MAPYLFSVVYKDGSTYQQNAEDVSVKTSDRSCYSDVDVDSVSEFTVGNTENFISVDLSNGYFKSPDKGWFKVHSEEGLEDFKLVYFKRVTLALSDEQNPDSSIRYFVGWDARKPDGQRVRCEMQLS